MNSPVGNQIGDWKREGQPWNFEQHALLREVVEFGDGAAFLLSVGEETILDDFHRGIVAEKDEGEEPMWIRVPRDDGQGVEKIPTVIVDVDILLAGESKAGGVK